MASRAQWRLGIFAVGLQMAIKLNQEHESEWIFSRYAYEIFLFRLFISQKPCITGGNPQVNLRCLR